MRIGRNGSTMRQVAFARKLYGAQGKSKKEIAYSVGYTTNVANSTKSKIENTRGFNNAMLAIARDSNNLVLAVMSEFKARGFEDFENKDLTNALTAISNACEKFNTLNKPDKAPEDPSKNKLRTVILQNIENQTLQAPSQNTEIDANEIIRDAEIVSDITEEVEELPDLDF